MSRIPWQILQDLYNKCLKERYVPDCWLTTLLVGVLKKHKSWRLPESYQVVGLESCLLKGLTWLIDRRIRAWAESEHLLPPSQNGFRPGLL
jgi:hypothetical protein